jgi:cysteine desulfurase
MIYFDNAAATPMDSEVIDAMRPYYSEKFYNPSANYLPAKQVKQDIDTSRALIAYWLGARKPEIIFTAGATEANNLAIRGVLEAFPKSNVITTTIEHESVLNPVKLFDHKLAAVNSAGIVEIDKLIGLIDDKTVLVSVMYANNEIGSIQPIKQIAQKLNAIRLNRQKKDNKLPLYFHTDAAQAPNYLDLHTARLGVDLMTINGGKIYGPKQSGFLYVKSGTKILPLIYGGGQENNLRSGTENVANIVGLSVALDKAQKIRESESKRLSKLQSILISELTDLIPSVVVNGSITNRLANNVHITIPGQDSERLLIKLEASEIYCASGSACSAAKGNLSHVLSAIGLSNDQVRSSIRITMGRTTKESDLKTFIDALREVA